MGDETLKVLALDLEAAGLTEEAEHLRSIETELEEVEHPPGLFGGLTQKVKDVAGVQWEHVVEELKQSKEVWDILVNKVPAGKSMTAEEEDLVRGQLADAFRMVPATFLMAVGIATPIPGTGILTPMALGRMGLLPSSWREAHVLRRLQDEAEHLTEIGHTREAGCVQEVIDRIREDLARRVDVTQKNPILPYYDDDEDGQIGESEQLAYEQTVLVVRQAAAYHPRERRWYFQLRQEVFGPARLTEMLALSEPIEGMLACFEGRSGWVKIEDLRDAVPDDT